MYQAFKVRTIGQDIAIVFDQLLEAKLKDPLIFFFSLSCFTTVFSRLFSGHHSVFAFLVSVHLWLR